MKITIDFNELTGSVDIVMDKPTSIEQMLIILNQIIFTKTMHLIHQKEDRKILKPI